MRVLIAEDDEVTAELLTAALQEFGYQVTVAANGREAFQAIRTGKYRLLISDWEMPEMSGLELCRRIRQRRWSGYVYVILLTSHSGVDNIVAGLDAGADDFLSKPFEPHELRVRLSTGRRILGLESRDLTIFALAKLAESRDPESGAHLERIREYSRLLAEELGRRDRYHDELDGSYVELLYLTTPLHDIGKVGIPDQVLLKPGRYTADEFAIMQQHTLIGARTLEAVATVNSDAEYLRMARDIALTHHEWFDGRGYPSKLSGEQIPLCGRITAVADVYDALTSKRIYKPAFTHDTAVQLIREGRGTQFDPVLVDAFLELEDDFQLIRKRFENVPSHFDGERLQWPAVAAVSPADTASR
ncbi:MAG TPA: HD domain-containing phosphohydrolase [Planctomycetaceae bacterium]|nr:HD domain-containing phosphohydrolase [Planctomycetaceae bacterium]